MNEGWNHSNVYYYEPVNIFFMKPSDIESEQYDGGYDIFAIREYN